MAIGDWLGDGEANERTNQLPPMASQPSITRHQPSDLDGVSAHTPVERSRAVQRDAPPPNPDRLPLYTCISTCSQASSLCDEKEERERYGIPRRNANGIQSLHG